ncbi:hypothetical protein ACDN41_12520 [Priestia aryabhattai]|uniref:hypothetical protein n=1 Tax=Priestia aryabhattai TaxID=412384 RepID=UPI003531E62B
MFRKEYKEVLKRLFVDSNEYYFESETKSSAFIDKVLLIAENSYSEEGYHHKYEEFEDFLYTSKVDGFASDVFNGEYGKY